MGVRPGFKVLFKGWEWALLIASLALLALPLRCAFVRAVLVFTPPVGFPRSSRGSLEEVTKWLAPRDFVTGLLEQSREREGLDGSPFFWGQSRMQLIPQDGDLLSVEVVGGSKESSKATLDSLLGGLAESVRTDYESASLDTEGKARLSDFSERIATQEQALAREHWFSGVQAKASFGLQHYREAIDRRNLYRAEAEKKQAVVQANRLSYCQLAEMSGTRIVPALAFVKLIAVVGIVALSIRVWLRTSTGKRF